MCRAGDRQRRQPCGPPSSAGVTWPVRTPAPGPASAQRSIASSSVPSAAVGYGRARSGQQLGEVLEARVVAHEQHRRAASSGSRPHHREQLGRAGVVDRRIEPQLAPEGGHERLGGRPGPCRRRRDDEVDGQPSTWPAITRRALRPRPFSGRSWSASEGSDQSDLAWRRRWRVFMRPRDRRARQPVVCGHLAQPGRHRGPGGRSGRRSRARSRPWPAPGRRPPAGSPSGTWPGWPRPSSRCTLHDLVEAQRLQVAHEHLQHGEVDAARPGPRGTGGRWPGGRRRGPPPGTAGRRRGARCPWRRSPRSGRGHRG